MEEYSGKKPNQKRSLPDDLFAPSLQGGRTGSGEAPWRLQSQLWTAFFGGTLAITLIAFMNGRRLGMKASKQNLVLATGAIGFVITLAAAIILNQIEVEEMWRPGESGFRVVSRAISLVAYLVLYQLQKSAFRIYVYYHGAEFDSLWKWGLVAIFGLGTLQNFIVIGIASMVAGG